MKRASQARGEQKRESIYIKRGGGEKALSGCERPDGPSTKCLRASLCVSVGIDTACACAAVAPRVYVCVCVRYTDKRADCGPARPAQRFSAPFHGAVSPGPRSSPVQRRADNSSRVVLAPWAGGLRTALMEFILGAEEHTHKENSSEGRGSQ